MYDLDIKPSADRIFEKLSKRNKPRLVKIFKKVKEIQENPHHKYKNLRKPLQEFKRVHIDSHFVLIFIIDHKQKLVEIYYFDHHDKAYKWRP